MHTRSFLVGLAPGCAIGVAAILAFGPLNPPAGPVSSTLKPLGEVEPRIAVNAANTPGNTSATYRITQPGSYYLTGNLQGTPFKHGIQILASDVTLDLNGFVLEGASASGRGVVVLTAQARICVKNGHVQSWGQDGIDLSLVESARVMDVTATGNLGNGVSVGEQGSIIDCHANDNGDTGLVASHTGVFRGCTAVDNGDGGIRGAFTAVVENCAAYSNTGYGILVSGGSVVTASTAMFNTGDGFGISAGATIQRCASVANDGHGISASSSCFILNNACDQNGDGASTGANIRVTFSGNRIEGNNCTDADLGIHVSGSGNIIVRNTCASNGTDYEIAANNVFGAILDRASPGSAAVSGRSAPSSTSTSDPNANFSY